MIQPLLPPTRSSSTPEPTPATEPPHRQLPKLRLKPLVYGAIALGGVALLVLAFRPAPIRVELGQVSRAPLQVTVDAEGKTRVRDRFVVASPVAGRLLRIELEEGDFVRQGVVVAQIDPLPLNTSIRDALSRLQEWRAQRIGVETQRPKAATLTQAQTRIRLAEANLRTAEARVLMAEAVLAQTQRERQRATRLEAAGAISPKGLEEANLAAITRTKELEVAHLGVKAAAAEVEVARAALAVLQAEQRDPDYLLRVYDARIASVESELIKLRDEAGRTAVRAPVSGPVLRILQKSATVVSAGTPLLEIGDPANLELVIDVLSSDAVHIQLGDPIQVLQGAGGRSPRARVQRLEPAAFTKISALGVEEQRVNVIGTFVDPPVGLGDGYRLDVQIVVWQGNEVLQVPLSALFRCGPDWCVFLDRQGRAWRQPVTIGQRSQLQAEVKQGLTVGQSVVLHPTDRITEGVRISPLP